MNNIINQENILNHKKTKEEHSYTSTGIKFWRHKSSMDSYREETGKTVISTHISPEGSCNLRCPYCSVSKRTRHNRIELETIKDYVLKLKSRGLKAVILTGGGEPTLYPAFDELVAWLKYEQNLSVALISNGTTVDRVAQSTWDCFSWVRISINQIDNYKERITFPRIKGILGTSMVYTGHTLEQMKEISQFVPEYVKYVRVLPNCLLNQENLIDEHVKILNILEELGDKRFFQQFKLHGSPCSSICHQAYFRPYLSEVDGGTVFPCDSLVLNDENMKFDEKYAICKASEILDFMDRKIDLQFDAQKLCSGCVFTDNIKLLDDWKRLGINQFDNFREVLAHEEFV